MKAAESMRRYGLPRCLVAITIALSSLACEPGRGTGSVSVEKRLASVERRTYDSAHPPAEDRRSYGGEQGFTWCDYHCDWYVKYDKAGQNSEAGSKMRITITSVKMTLDLKTTMWLPEPRVAAMIDHENG